MSDYLEVVMWVAGMILPWIIAGYYHSAARQRKQLSWSDSQSLINGPRFDIKGLAITYEGRTVDDPSVVDVAIWNSGNVPIVCSDLPGEGALLVHLHSGHIISAKTKIAPPQVSELDFTLTSAGVRVTFNHINQGDGFRLQLLCSNVETKHDVVHIHCPMIGQTAHPKRISAPVTPFLYAYRTLFFMIFNLYTSVIFVLVGLRVYLDSHDEVTLIESLTDVETVSVIFAGILTSISAWTVRVRNIPTHLVFISKQNRWTVMFRIVRRTIGEARRALMIFVKT